MNPKDVYARSIRHFLFPVAALLDDESISEVLINGPDTVYFEKNGRLQLSEFRFPDSGFVMAAARNIGEFVGRTIDRKQHSLDARLPDGSRVHVIVPPSS